VALIVLGLMSAAVAIDDLAKGVKEDIVLGFLMSISFVLAGILIRRNLKSGHLPGWRMMVGGFMVFFAVTGLAVELDSLITNTSEDLAVGITMVGIFAAVGYLLARSGYRRQARKQITSIKDQLRTSFVSNPNRFAERDVPASDETVAAGSIRRDHK
jgi:hypothetical protein